MALPVRAEEVSRFSPRVQQLVAQLEPIDQSLKPLVVEYHSQANATNIEPKVDALMATRVRLADQLTKAVERELKDLRSRVETAEQKMKRMYKRLAKLETGTTKARSPQPARSYP